MKLEQKFIFYKLDNQRKQTSKLKRNQSSNSRKDNSDSYIGSDYDETYSLSSKQFRGDDSIQNIPSSQNPLEYVVPPSPLHLS